MANEYIPGVCNIGEEEISRRRKLGWIGLAVAVVLFAVLFWVGVDVWWRLLVFFPAAFSASGFLQAHFGFCSGYARTGVFNFGMPGKTTVVADEASKAKDRKKGSRITMYAVLIGALVALACVFV